MLDKPDDKIYKNNKFDINNWRDFPYLLTNSFWDFPVRWKHSSHKGDYHGNFIPQIPFQSIMRYTDPGDTILDVFMGSGTSLIEAALLGRNGVGIDLSKEACDLSEERINQAIAEDKIGHAKNVKFEIVHGNCVSEKTMEYIEKKYPDKFDHIFVHPPYHDIIKFSNNVNDLSNNKMADFLSNMRIIAKLARGKLLKKNKFLTLVIGDKYENGEIVQLGFKCSELFQYYLQLKSVNVKNMKGNEKGKGKNTNLHRYRALKNGYQVFGHEYVFIFKNGR